MNINAARVLTGDKELCSASIHCAYYSCYQLINYFLNNELHLDEMGRKQQYDNYVRGQKNTGGKILGSHEYWLSQFINNFKSKKPCEASRVYGNLMKLKHARTKADYSTTDYFKKDTDQLYEMAKDTRKRIIKTYES